MSNPYREPGERPVDPLFSGSGEPDVKMGAADPGDFVFRLSDGTEVLRLGKGGRSQIHGRLIEVDDGTAWRTFKEWLEHAKVSPPGEVIGRVE